MNERLDLSGVWHGYLSDNGGSLYSAGYDCVAEAVLVEALRAQASEDEKAAEIEALKERVRLLEEVIRIDVPRLSDACWAGHYHDAKTLRNKLIALAGGKESV